MNPTEYIQQAIKTESAPKTINFGTLGLHSSLAMFCAAADVADLIKRAIFYGKELDMEKFQGLLEVVANNAGFLFTQSKNGLLTDPKDLDKIEVLGESLSEIDLANVNIRLLHAALGHFSESGEKLMAIGRQLEGHELDKVNYSEEIGDGLWYSAVELDELSLTFEQVMRQNIKKLQDKFAGRYKTGEFSNEQAINRDVVAERQVLEESIKPQ